MPEEKSSQRQPRHVGKHEAGTLRIKPLLRVHILAFTTILVLGLYHESL